MSPLLPPFISATGACYRRCTVLSLRYIRPVTLPQHGRRARRRQRSTTRPHVWHVRSQHLSSHPPPAPRILHYPPASATPRTLVHPPVSRRIAGGFHSQRAQIRCPVCANTEEPAEPGLNPMQVLMVVLKIKNQQAAATAEQATAARAMEDAKRCIVGFPGARALLVGAALLAVALWSTSSGEVATTKSISRSWADDQQCGMHDFTAAVPEACETTCPADSAKGFDPSQVGNSSKLCPSAGRGACPLQWLPGVLAISMSPSPQRQINDDLKFAITSHKLVGKTSLGAWLLSGCFKSLGDSAESFGELVACGITVETSLDGC